MHDDEIAFGRARTVELTDADRGHTDNARGVDLRIGYRVDIGRPGRPPYAVTHDKGPLP